jgi:protoheme IX farnesyltransferase
MLSVLDQSGAWVAGWSLVNTVALIVVTLLPAWLGLASHYYTGAAALCGAWFLWLAIGFMRPANRNVSARRLFLASIAYLPLVLGALVVDRLWVN